MKLLVIRDESSKILGHRYLNSQISFCLGLLQLTICIWALAQHFFSIFYYNQILFCDFINGTKPVLLVGVDIIIFDIGLFHSLWGIDSCVAQYLDGGYGRCMWCVCHTLAFLVCLPFAFVSRPRPYSLWPLLIQQSAYGVGLLILSLAALPRVLPTFTGDQNSASLFSVSIYATGASLNFFLVLFLIICYISIGIGFGTLKRCGIQQEKYARTALIQSQIAALMGRLPHMSTLRIVLLCSTFTHTHAACKFNMSLRRNSQLSMSRRSCCHCVRKFA
ncbi:unnamed protein product [Onchocerca ochengi]|uniref:G protein-coupled receptor n=1 Tax=Onchocerca ochengi TaxID=42157 RepID=A0A182E8A2_ONCOC|nr:unnamed protein product [Onchocerca ochengi]